MIGRIPLIKIAEAFSPEHRSLWQMLKQSGIEHAVGCMDFSGGVDVPRDQLPWSYMSLLQRKTAYEDAGFGLAVLESRPPMTNVKLGLPGRDAEIEAVCDLIRNMGALGIRVWCYEWMPVFNWLRTSTTVPSRGGALATGYDHSLMRNAPLTEYGVVSEDELWANLACFLERVVPVAEEAGVKLAMHPDDPPLSPIRGLGRVMRSIDNFQRLIDLVPSPVNGIAFCQGAVVDGDVDLVVVVDRAQALAIGQVGIGALIREIDEKGLVGFYVGIAVDVDAHGLVEGGGPGQEGERSGSGGVVAIG